jgi:ABC-type branched-subunit amino acid transport system ATPase component
MGGYLLPGREVSARIDHVVSVFPRLGQMLTRRAGRLSGGGQVLMADTPARLAVTVTCGHVAIRGYQEAAGRH